MPDRVEFSQARDFLASKYGAVGELRALGGGFWSSAYAFSHAGRALVVRFDLEDVRPDQSEVAGPMLASLLGALFRVPKSSEPLVGRHWQPPRSDLTWRGWLSERLVDNPERGVHA